MPTPWWPMSCLTPTSRTPRPTCSSRARHLASAPLQAATRGRGRGGRPSERNCPRVTAAAGAGDAVGARDRMDLLVGLGAALAAVGSRPCCRCLHPPRRHPAPAASVLVRGDRSAPGVHEPGPRPARSCPFAASPRQRPWARRPARQQSARRGDGACGHAGLGHSKKARPHKYHRDQHGCSQAGPLRAAPSTLAMAHTVKPSIAPTGTAMGAAQNPPSSSTFRQNPTLWISVSCGP